jgi:hypothetical protein
VRRLLGAWMALIVLGATALGVASFTFPGQRHTALDAFILFLGALGLAAGVRATRTASPHVHAPALANELSEPPGPQPERPAELERLEREVHLSLAGSFHMQQRLVPVLREIAANRLLLRHGLDLDARPEAAQRLLGEAAWSWLRPDRPELRDRWAPGPPLAELKAVIDALERI